MAKEDDKGGDGATPPKPKPDPDALGDAGKAALVEIRKERDAALARAKELEDRDKSEMQKATDRVTAAEARAEAAETRAMRIEVALDAGLTVAQAKRLSGTSRAELEADAKEFAATLKPASGDADGGDGNGGDGAGNGSTPPPSRKPVPDLQGGGDTTKATDKDIRAVVDSIPR